MSNNPAIRPLRLPPPNIAQIKVPRTRVPARTWYRVHQAQFEAIYFSLSPGHRFSHSQCPYPILYLGADIDTCLFERFGGSLYQKSKTLSASLWQASNLATIQIPDIYTCDLSHGKTLSALMVDLGSLMHNDLTIPQQWGLAIQQHAASFQAIRYESRFNGEPGLVLFQRDGLEERIVQIGGEKLLLSEPAVDWLHKHKIGLY